MSDTLTALEDLAGERVARDGLVAALAASREHAAHAQERVAAARQRLDDESADVAALESFSMTRVLAAVKGSREADLDRERAEQVAARYAVAEAEARAAAEEREVASLTARIDAYGDLDTRHAELLARREGEVGADPAHASTATRLGELAATVGELRARAVQLEEADDAGREAHRALELAADHLGSAGSWATYDTFFGGGMIGDMVKHDKLDRAAALMREADAALARLGSELADVGIDAVGDIGITSMTRALDVWFDNIVSDWAVRDRIAQASRRVQELQVAVVRLGQELRQQLAENRAALDDASRERERLLLGGV